MSRRKAFDSGFGAPDSPSPEEVASLGTRIEALRGQAQGYTTRQQAQVHSILSGVEQLADSSAEMLGEAIGNELGDVAMVAVATDQRAQQALSHALLAPYETALAYGFRPEGAPGQGRGGRAGSRRGKRRKGGPSGSGDGPPLDPAAAETPLPTGSGALPFDPPADPVDCPPGQVHDPNWQGFGVSPCIPQGSAPTAPTAPTAPPSGETLCLVSPDGKTREDVPVLDVPDRVLQGWTACQPAAPAPPDMGYTCMISPYGGPPRLVRDQDVDGLLDAGWTIPAGCNRPTIPPGVGPPVLGGMPPIVGFPPALPLPPIAGLPGFPVGGAPIVPPGPLPPIGVPPIGAPVPPGLPGPGQPPGMPPIGPPVQGMPGMPGFPLPGPGGAPPGVGGFPVGPVGCPVGPAPVCPAPVQGAPVAPVVPGAPVVPVAPGAPGAGGAPTPTAPASPGTPSAGGSGLVVNVSCPPPQIIVNTPPCPTLPGVLSPPAAPPAAPPGGPGGTETASGPVWGEEGLGISAPLLVTLASCLPADDVIQTVSGKSLKQILQGLNVVDDNGKWNWYTGMRAKYGSDPSVFDSAILAAGDLAEFVLSGIGRLFQGWQQFAPLITGGAAPDAGTALAIQSLIGFVRRWIADLPPEVTRIWDNYTRAAIPTGMPTSDWANSALATNRISKDEWRCLVRAAGDAWEWQLIDTDMRREQVSDDQLIMLSRKGQLLRGDDLDSNLKRRGWTDDAQREYLKRANVWTPGASDAVNWMLKDVQDPKIQERFGLGDEFDLKYSGHVKEVFDWNGISKQDANYIWRAHWRNMSPTTLYEMLHRLRPGWANTLSDDDAMAAALAVAPAEDAAKLTDGPAARAYLAALETPPDSVETALGQADYPPFWRARLMAVSYNVLTRVDIRRAFETGSLTEEQTIAQFQNRGYTAGDARTLFTFYREAALQTHTRRPAANQWVKTGYDTSLLLQTLQDQGMRPDMGADVLKRLKTRRAIHIQTTCIDAIKRRFLTGTLTDDGAQAALLSVPLSAERVGDIIQEWKCLKRSVPKHETAQQICKEFKAGLIAGNQAARLLRGLGYTAIQARRILSLCYLSPTPKGLKHMPTPGSKEAAQLDDALGS